MNALFYVELDIRYCALTYGIAPCQASLSVESQNDASTMALLEFEGADASTTITDDADGTSNTWTANGNAQLDTAQFKFGTASLLLDGTGDYVSTPDNAAFTLGGGDFTIDFWFRCNDAGGATITPAGQISAAGGGDANAAWFFNKTAANVMQLVTQGAGTVTVTGTTAFTNAVNTGWHHCAGVRTGNILKLFIDGVQEGGDVALVGSVNNSPSALAVGRPGEFNGQYWNGWIDEFRLSVGVARWTSNFTPPTAAFASAFVGTGDHKCFNSPATCQDRENFLDQGIAGSSPYNPTTLRFAVDTYYLPDNIECLPYIRNPDDIEITPAIVSLGQNLGQRATIRVRMRDARHSDTGTGGDKYLSERPYNPFVQGTFFGKLRARQPFLRGQNMRLIHGELGQTLEEMETRHFVVESFSGPSADGVYELIGKDVLKFADGDRAQAPRLSNGFLVADITAVQTSLILSPAGIGNEEYTETGHVAIGGKEVVQFWRDSSAGNDLGVNTKLLIQCDGAEGSTSFTDAAQARTITNNLSLVSVDNDIEVFVSGCGLFGGNQYLSLADHNDWTPAGDFTWEMWIRPALLLGSNRYLVSHRTDANNEFHFRISAAGRIIFEVVDTSSQIILCESADGAILIDTNYHIALVRSGNNFNIYRNGISIASVTDASAIPNFAGGLNIGVRADVASFFNGRMDEIRLSHVARWTTTFTPPVAPYLTSSDNMQIERAKFNTEAQSHNDGDRVQLCLVYTGQDVADIIYDLLVNYAAVPADYIQLATWQGETANFLGTVYTALIGDPHAVEELCAELIEQAGLSVWWDEINRLIHLQVLRGITDVDSFNEDNTNEGTLKITDQPDKRISQVDVYFAKLNPLLKQDEVTNYRSTASLIDLVAEEDYGTPAIKKIYSRWIPDLGRSIADRLIEVLFSRYRDPPRRFEFEVMRNAVDTLQLGRGYRIESWALQDDTGAQVDAPIQLTRVNPTGAVTKVEAEEMLFAAAAVDLANRRVIVDSNIFNINLRTAHDASYPEPVGGETVTCTINSNVIVGSTSSAIPAFNVGSWPVGVTIDIIVLGRIQGKGGGGAFAAGDFAGGSGGTALLTTYAVTVTATGGEIWGGAGGGGAMMNSLNLPACGGGGAGQLPGAGATSSESPHGDSQPGTTEAGGAAGIPILGAGTAGAGGGPGLAGGNAVGGNTNGTGGAAGNSIDGDSFVTLVGGDIRGPQIG